MFTGAAIGVYSRNMIVKQNSVTIVYPQCVQHSENTLYCSLFLSVLTIYFRKKK